MHPDPAFAWDDEAAMRRFVAARGFAHLFVAAAGRPTVAHVPVTVANDGTVRFHIARANRIASLLDGAEAIASVSGTDFYVSPDWYGLPHQVPTWNYVAVEIEGRLHALDDEALVAQIDALAAGFEAPLTPKPAWTRAGFPLDRFAAMCEAIRAYELRPTAWRGTRKLGQNKPSAARAAVAHALDASGRDEAARAMRDGGGGA